MAAAGSEPRSSAGGGAARRVGIRCLTILTPAPTALDFRNLCEIQRHVLRVSWRRCERIVEIQAADAVRLHGPNAIWKDVSQRLLDDTCRQRTGSPDEDGCWPGFDMA